MSVSAFCTCHWHPSTLEKLILHFSLFSLHSPQFWGKCEWSQVDATSTQTVFFHLYPKSIQGNKFPDVLVSSSSALWVWEHRCGNGTRLMSIEWALYTAGLLVSIWGFFCLSGIRWRLDGRLRRSEAYGGWKWEVMERVQIAQNTQMLPSPYCGHPDGRAP